LIKNFNPGMVTLTFIERHSLIKGNVIYYDATTGIMMKGIVDEVIDGPGYDPWIIVNTDDLDGGVILGMEDDVRVYI
jgi:hypothetical protein